MHPGLWGCLMKIGKSKVRMWGCSNKIPARTRLPLQGMGRQEFGWTNRDRQPHFSQTTSNEHYVVNTPES